MSGEKKSVFHYLIYRLCVSHKQVIDIYLHEIAHKKSHCCQIPTLLITEEWCFTPRAKGKKVYLSGNHKKLEASTKSQ